jgi:hypothetical protein
MAAPRSTDGTLDELPRAFRAALGVSRQWMDLAACRNQIGERREAWKVRVKDVVVFDGSSYTGRELIAYALEVCARCPVQHACAAFAVETEAAVGTWATTHDDIEWLQSRPDWRTILASADQLDIGVRVAVQALRTAIVAE